MTLDVLPRGRLLAEFSLWSADLGRLAEEMARVDWLVDLYHLDVADGRFSPALPFFPDLVANLRKRTRRPMHVHLMVEDAILLDQVAQFAEAGRTSSASMRRTRTPGRRWSRSRRGGSLAGSY